MCDGVQPSCCQVQVDGNQLWPINSRSFISSETFGHLCPDTISTLRRQEADYPVALSSHSIFGIVFIMRKISEIVLLEMYGSDNSVS